MRIFLVVKIIALFLVLGAVAGTAYLMERYTGSMTDMPGTMMKQQQLMELDLKHKAVQGVKSDNQPGEKAYLHAKQLLAMEAVTEAEEKLKYIVSFYPLANSATEARRILGEINIDRLLDPTSKAGKKTITVQNGDSYTALVQKHNTTFDNLMHVSQLKRANPRGLKVGQKLTVMALEMSVVIDLKRQTLTLLEGGDFVKDYPIIRTSYKPEQNKELFKITSIKGRHGNHLYPSHSESYRDASKVLFLSNKSLSIRALTEDDAEAIDLAFYLETSHMEELPLLLRPGNDVEIRN